MGTYVPKGRRHGGAETCHKNGYIKLGMKLGGLGMKCLKISHFMLKIRQFMPTN
jgi:hypothetical protein